MTDDQKQAAVDVSIYVHCCALRDYKRVLAEWHDGNASRDLLIQAKSDLDAARAQFAASTAALVS